MLGSFADQSGISAPAAHDGVTANTAARWSRWSIAGVPSSGGGARALSGWTTLTSTDLGLDRARSDAASSASGWLEQQSRNRAHVRAFLNSVLPPLCHASNKRVDAHSTRRVGNAASEHNARSQSGPPVAPLTVLVMSYELGRVLESAPTPRDLRPPRALAPGTPLLAACRLDEAICHDRLVVAGGGWSLLGTPSAGSPLMSVLDHLARQLDRPARDDYSLAPLSLGSEQQESRHHYEHAVARAVRLIRDGDLFQVNLAHPLTTKFRGSHRALFADLARSASPWFGALLELPEPWPTVLSASPELLLHLDPATRKLTTRPIKGTRPRHTDPRDLLASSKDRAELNMITDLMRNDLGRVAQPGSVRVEAAREIETHRVHHTVATISASLRDDVSPADALLACFPGGSITGAPKVRAMQVIEELESEPRGVYCGCIVFADATGRLVANIAIRTLSLGPQDASGERTLVYPVGAGIVADSDPASEYAETIAKADALMQLIRG